MCHLMLSLRRKFDHLTPVLKILHWRSVEQSIKYKLLLLTYKALYSKAPAYLPQLISVYTPNLYLQWDTSHFWILWVLTIFNLALYKINDIIIIIVIVIVIVIVILLLLLSLSLSLVISFIIVFVIVIVIVIVIFIIIIIITVLRLAKTSLIYQIIIIIIIIIIIVVVISSSIIIIIRISIMIF